MVTGITLLHQRPAQNWRGTLSRWPVLLLLFSLPAAFAHSRFYPSADFDILIDMKVDDKESGPGVAEMWINDTLGQPLRQTYQPGLRQALRFELKGYSSISYLRLDPTSHPNSPIRVYSIRITNGGHDLHCFSARDPSGWHHNCNKSAAQDDALYLWARHDDPSLDAHFPSISAREAGRAGSGRSGTGHPPATRWRNEHDCSRSPCWPSRRSDC
jgi:hypothetical protein